MRAKFSTILSFVIAATPAFAHQPSNSKALNISNSECKSLSQGEQQFIIELCGANQEKLRDKGFCRPNILSTFKPVADKPGFFKYISIDENISATIKCESTTLDQGASSFVFTELKLQNLGLNELPLSLGSFVNLTELNLTNNELSFLPSTISRLIRLRIFNVSHNRLTELPEEITACSELITLDISNNPDLQFVPLELQDTSKFPRLFIKSDGKPNLIGQ